MPAAVCRSAWRTLSAAGSAWLRLPLQQQRQPLRLISSVSSSNSSCSRSRTRVLYDGGCPLCSREVALLRKANERSDAFEFCDITRPEEFEPAARPHGITRDQAMRELHVIGQDGKVYKGVEAFRRMYSDAGWDGLVEITKVPSVNRLLTSSYAWFAKHRSKLRSLTRD